MANKGRFVFDTNILVRATLISDSTAGQAFRKARQLGEILSSVSRAEELNEVLSREKFDRYITAVHRRIYSGSNSNRGFGNDNGMS